MLSGAEWLRYAAHIEHLVACFARPHRKSPDQPAAIGHDKGANIKRILHLSVIAAALAAPALAGAQPAGYVGPSSSKAAKGHAGMANAPLMTAKDLLAKGKDDQYVRLQGKLLSHKGGEDYEFADASGKMTVEIDDDRFPQGVRIDQNTMVELVGEFDKDLIGAPSLDVKQIKVVNQPAATGR